MEQAQFSRRKMVLRPEDSAEALDGIEFLAEKMMGRPPLT